MSRDTRSGLLGAVLGADDGLAQGPGGEVLDGADRFEAVCPLWNVYEAFAAPGRTHVQVAEMPDGRRYLWTVRALTRHRGGWGEPGKTYAIALGCEIRHAARLVHADGLNLGSAAATPIGMGCRSCERTDCPPGVPHPRSAGD